MKDETSKEACRVVGRIRWLLQRLNLDTGYLINDVYEDTDGFSIEVSRSKHFLMYSEKEEDDLSSWVIFKEDFGQDDEGSWDYVKVLNCVNEVNAISALVGCVVHDILKEVDIPDKVQPTVRMNSFFEFAQDSL